MRSARIEPQRRRSFWRLVLLAAQGLLPALLSLGCAEDSSGPKPGQGSGPVTTTQPTGRDFMNYRPFDEKPNISGGGLGDYDKKGMHDDLKSFWNP